MALIASVAVRSPDGHSFVASAARNTTGATLLTAALTREGPELPVLTDTYFNTWVPLTPQTIGGRILQPYQCENPSVGVGHKFNIGGTASNVYPSLAVAAFDVVNTYDTPQENGNVSASGTTIQAGAVTPSNAISLVVAFAQNLGVFNFFSIDSGFTIAEQLTEGGFSDSVALAYKVKAAASAENPTWSFVNGSASEAVIASFIYYVPPPPETRVTQNSLVLAESDNLQRVTQFNLVLAICEAPCAAVGCIVDMSPGAPGDGSCLVSLPRGNPGLGDGCRITLPTGDGTTC